jgi:hypothetical protein
MKYGGMKYGGMKYGGMKYGGMKYGGMKYGGMKYGGMKYPMTIEQTVEIPADHRPVIEVPPEIPVCKINQPTPPQSGRGWLVLQSMDCMRV